MTTNTDPSVLRIFWNDEYADIEVNDNSYRHRAIKGEHNITLYFSMPEHIEIPVGAYCVFENETYTLETPENVKMLSPRNFEYTLVMEAAQVKLNKYKFRNPTDNRLKFSYTGKPEEFLKMLVDNLNQRDSGWSAGSCLEAVDKMIAFNHTNCMDALNQIAEAFDTEWEVVGKTIHLRKVEYDKENPLPLSYGQGNGFKPGVGRSNFDKKRPVEVLFVQGGERNIFPKDGEPKELILPKNATLLFDGICFEGEAGFDAEKAVAYISDAEGISVRRRDQPLQTKEEGSLDCSEIYPNWLHTITDIDSSDKKFWYITDLNTPAALNYRNCIIQGEGVTIIFQSGKLVGREFSIKKRTDEGIETLEGYDPARKRFKIEKQVIDGAEMPDDYYKPAIGDTFRVFGIRLPKEYVWDNATKTGAAWEMFRKAVRHLSENETPRFSFTGELDGIWAKKDWLNIGGRIRLGGYVLFSDPRFQPEGVGIRITGIKDYINNPYSPEIELSNSVVGASVMSDLRKIGSNEVVAEDNRKEALQFAKRRHHDALETMEMLNGALLDNFTGSVNPITVQTMAMLVGDESLQFRFVNNTTAPSPVKHIVRYDKELKVLTLPGGIIQHLTLGVKTISSQHNASEYRYWSVPAFNTPPLTEGAKKYYLYAKVSATANTGIFLISETAVGIGEVNGYYHLLLGVLNSEFAGDRSFVPLYGFTEILPGRIAVDRITSPDGNLDINLSSNPATITAQNGAVIRGDIRFSNGESVSEEKDKIARGLGYESYADMEVKTGSVGTIVSGGYINTDVINTDTLVANSIKTNPEGERVEILKSSNNIAIYQKGRTGSPGMPGGAPGVPGVPAVPDSDDGSTLVTEINGVRYGSLAKLLAVSSSSSYTFSPRSWTGTYTKESVGSALKGTFNAPIYTIASNITKPADGTWQLNIPAYRIDLNIEPTVINGRENNGAIYANVLLGSRVLATATCRAADRTVSVEVPALTTTINTTVKITFEVWGNYDVRVNNSMDVLRPITFTASCSAVNSTDKINFTEINRVSKMFANGHLYKYSDAKYFAVIDTVSDPLVTAQGLQRYISPNGKKKLEINDAGVHIGTWNPTLSRWDYQTF